MFTFGTKTTPTVFSITFWPIQTQPTRSPFAPSSVEYFAWRKQQTYHHQLEQNSLKEESSAISWTNPLQTLQNGGIAFSETSCRRIGNSIHASNSPSPKSQTPTHFPSVELANPFSFRTLIFQHLPSQKTSWIKLWEQNLGKLGWLWRFFFFQIFFEVFFFQISCKILSLRVKMDSNPYIRWVENQTRFI